MVRHFLGPLGPTCPSCACRQSLPPAEHQEVCPSNGGDEGSTWPPDQAGPRGGGQPGRPRAWNVREGDWTSRNPPLGTQMDRVPQGCQGKGRRPKGALHLVLRGPDLVTPECLARVVGSEARGCPSACHGWQELCRRAWQSLQYQQARGPGLCTSHPEASAPPPVESERPSQTCTAGSSVAQGKPSLWPKAGLRQT